VAMTRIVDTLRLLVDGLDTPTFQKNASTVC
jgi:hypothetical protein